MISEIKLPLDRIEAYRILLTVSRSLSQIRKNETRSGFVIFEKMASWSCFDIMLLLVCFIYPTNTEKNKNNVVGRNRCCSTNFSRRSGHAIGEKTIIRKGRIQEMGRRRRGSGGRQKEFMIQNNNEMNYKIENDRSQATVSLGRRHLRRPNKNILFQPGPKNPLSKQVTVC
jgi:hypothetical protein